ncbi:MAG: response regulator [Verrucomicrobiales bacterium]|nr:response regulator [Verrucomicrobiales bacterium]
MTKSRILLVDDDHSMRLALRRALDREGYQVFEAGNGHEALRQLENQAVDLVITDIIMPDSEGIELTFALRKRHPGLPVIAMSGGGEWAPEPYLAIARTAGAAHVFAKPFLMDEFLGRVRSLLGDEPEIEKATLSD